MQEFLDKNNRVKIIAKRIGRVAASVFIVSMVYAELKENTKQIAENIEDIEIIQTEMKSFDHTMTEVKTDVKWIKSYLQDSK